MVKDSDLSPEKQLLKLIEEPQSQLAQETAAKSKKSAILSPAAMKGRWSFFKDSIDGLQKTWGAPLDLKKINLLLGIFAFLTGAYFMTNLVLLSLRLSNVPSFSFQTDKAGKIDTLKKVSQLKALTYYMEKVGSRDIFKLGRTPTAAGKAQSALSQAELDAIIKKYKLVGISWSDNPDAMIEDAEGGKTYFLKRGQALDTYKIKAIFKDKVILDCKGQEVELR